MAGPGNQGSVIAVLLSLLGAVLVCSCCGLSAFAATPRAAAARGVHFLLVATPTPNFGSTEVTGTTTPTIPGAPTATATAVKSPTATVPVVTSPTTIPPTPTKTTTPGATATATKATTPTTATPTTATPTTPPVLPTATTTGPALTPTASPVPVPTPTPTPSSGPAVLGAQKETFVAKYGQPTDGSDPATGRFQFQRYAGTSTDFLIVQLDIYDTSAVSDRAYSITAQHPPDHFWSTSEAQGICGAFMPGDARFQGEVKIPGSGGADGVDQVYISSTLAGIFPASAFVDGAQHRVKPGTFDVRYTYASPGDTGHVQTCQLEVGKQQAPAAVTGNG